MVVVDLNFSVLGLKNRVGDAATIAQIYAEYYCTVLLSLVVMCVRSRVEKVLEFNVSTLVPDTRHYRSDLCGRGRTLKCSSVIKAINFKNKIKLVSATS